MVLAWADTPVLVVLAASELVLVAVAELADAALVAVCVAWALEFVACLQVADVAQTAAATLLLLPIADAKLLL